MANDGAGVRVLSDHINFSSRNTDISREQTESTPVVLWGRSGPQAVLSLLERQERVITPEGAVLSLVYRFDRHPLKTGEKSLGELWREAADDYPVTYRANVKNYLDREEIASRSLVDTKGILTADVNGDGVEELIIPRMHGEVDVYDTGKRLFHSRALKKATPRYQKILTHVASFEDRDVVYCVYDREPAAILQIDKSGIRQIALRADWTMRQILAVGAINYPGSREVDELAVLHKLETDGSNDIYPAGQPPDRGEHVYLSRFKTDGTLIAKTRMFYASFSDYGSTRFVFVPQSRQTVMEGAEGTYLVTPEKPSDWVRQLKPNGDFFGVMRGGKGLIVLLRDGLKIYAVDEDSRFHTRGADGMPAIGGEGLPLYTIKQESPRHDVLEILRGKHVDRQEFLVVEDRVPRMGVALPWQDYLAVAEKYMKDDVRQERLRELKRKSERYFDIPDAEIAEREYKERYGKSISLPTREDVRKHFPEHYAKLQADSEKEFRKLVVSKLFYDPGKDESIYYKDHEGFRRWVESQIIPDDSEMVFTLYSDFREAGRARLPKHYRRYFRGDEHRLNMPLTGFRRAGDLLSILAVGQKKTGDDNKDVSPPIWLLIKEKGGQR